MSAANEFQPLSLCVLTVSDTRTAENDTSGDILAAEFVNQGAIYRAVLNTDGNYYTPEGKAMRKSFLRAPVNFKYISSNFNPRRLHPVTGKVRPHNGIDYVAPVGTPIMAAGSGSVVAAGYNQFNGNYVFIKHAGNYVTKYLHLSKRTVNKGQRVKQGQTIGNLGGTGRVTGPHLHYEFVVGGVHKNPRTLTLPQATGTFVGVWGLAQAMSRAMGKLIGGGLYDLGRLLPLGLGCDVRGRGRDLHEAVVRLARFTRG